MKLLAFVLAAVVMSVTAQAAVLKLDEGKSAKQGVNISAGGTATVNSKDYPLTTVGSGLRQKRVFAVVKVYIAQLLVGDTTKYVKSEADALSSLANENAYAMNLTFLREVPMEKLTSAFEEGFAANHVSMNDPDIKKFMEMVSAGGAGEESGTLSVIVVRNDDGTETVTYEMIRSHQPYVGSVTGAAGLGKKVFALWLGEPADDYLAQLKTELMQ